MGVHKRGLTVCSNLPLIQTKANHVYILRFLFYQQAETPTWFALRSQRLAIFSNFRKSVYFVPETLHRIQVSFRPSSHISGYFLIRNFFFPWAASVHTYPMNPAYESAIFWIRYDSGIRWKLNPDIFLSDDVTRSSSGSGFSNGGWRYPPDKSQSSGYMSIKEINCFTHWIE